MSELSKKVKELLAKTLPLPRVGWVANCTNDAELIAFIQNNADEIIAALEAAEEGP